MSTGEARLPGTLTHVATFERVPMGNCSQGYF